MSLIPNSQNPRFAGLAIVAPALVVFGLGLSGRSFGEAPSIRVNFASYQLRSVADKPSCGKSYRISLMMSAQFRSHLGTPATQDTVGIAVKERLSMRTPAIVELVKNVSPSTSEDAAKRIYAKVEMHYREVVASVEDELSALIGSEAYDHVLRVQLGLLGVQGLSDSELATLLNLSDPTLEKIRAIVTPGTVGKVNEARVLSMLGKHQRSIFEQCQKEAAAFRESEAKRVTKSKEAILGKSLTELGFLDDKKGNQNEEAK